MLFDLFLFLHDINALSLKLSSDVLVKCIGQLTQQFLRTCVNGLHRNLCGCCNRVLWDVWNGMMRRYRRQVHQEKPRETPPRPKRTTELCRARHYRNRKGATDPKDLIPNDLKLINWTDDNGNEVFTRRTLSLTLGQVRSVSGQLGYMPLNIVSIGAINMKPKMQEFPLVAILYPLTMDKLTRQGRSHLLKNQNESKERGSVDGSPFQQHVG